MPKTVTLEDGTEIELPDTILGEIKDEAVEEFKGEHGDPEELKEQLESKESEKSDLEEKIRIAAEKGENASKLREQLKAKDKEIEDAKLQAQTASANTNNLLIEEWKDRAVKQVSDDPKIKEVFDANYKLLENMPSNTKEEIEKRISTALDLTQPGWRANSVDTTAFSSAGARGGTPKKEGGFNETQKNVASQLGLTEEQLEKYGKGGK